MKILLFPFKLILFIITGGGYNCFKRKEKLNKNGLPSTIHLVKIRPRSFVPRKAFNNAIKKTLLSNSDSVVENVCGKRLKGEFFRITELKDIYSHDPSAFFDDGVLGLFSVPAYTFLVSRGLLDKLKTFDDILEMSCQDYTAIIYDIRKHILTSEKRKQITKELISEGELPENCNECGNQLVTTLNSDGDCNICGTHYLRIECGVFEEVA